MDGKCFHLSPVSVVTGFTCESSELQSPRSSAATDRSTSQLRSPVSLLSLLLTTTQQNAMHAWEEDDDDDDDCYSDCEGYEDGLELGDKPAGAQTQASGMTHPSAPCPTAPVDVPSVLWLKEPQAVNELRRMHYERWQRRVMMEKELAREAQQRANATANAAMMQQAAQQRADYLQYQQHLRQVQQQAQ